MSQQEYLFGVMWQRLMAKLQVRLHYGHPDIFNKIFMMTRGGTAKASQIVNVSEDIFAGFVALSRGGESSHIEFMQVGKGRDVGMIQIETFESKISGGTAISMTTRDSFRFFEGLDFSRLLSFWHTCGGFYISNVLIVFSFMASLYYMSMMALVGLDRAVLASNSVYLLGEVSFLQWFMQLGLLSMIPLFALYMLEVGIFSAMWRMVKMMLSFAPIFFMFEIQTKAYYYDHALCFGKQGYMATGRDFVFRHLSFDEVFRSTSQSHMYLGMEALVMLILTTSFGTFQSIEAYMFFFITGWLFTVSLLFGALWFNPFAMEIRFLRKDVHEWLKWMMRETGAPEACWTSWYEREAGNQYLQANIGARIWRAFRVSRLLLFTIILISRCPSAGAMGDILIFALFVGLGLATVFALQLVHFVTMLFPSVADDNRAIPLFFRGNATRRILQIIVIVGMVGGAAIVSSLGGGLTISGLICGIIAYHFSLFWASRILNIISFWPLRAGIRASHKVIDAEIGLVVLFIQFAATIIIPIGYIVSNACR
jgi:callose synthase